jgi:hypothetical protein
MPAGRPTKYSEKVVLKLCKEIATSSKSLRTICELDEMPSVQTILTWLRDNPEFLARYTQAKEMQADFMIEEMIEIADDGTNDFMTITKGSQTYNIEDKEVTNRSRLRVDTRKWIASKLKPKKYADRLTTEIQALDKQGNPTDQPATILLNIPVQNLSQIEQLLREGE